MIDFFIGFYLKVKLSMSREKVANYFFIFMLFDILFLPNFIMSTPISFFIYLIGVNYFFRFERNTALIYFCFLIVLFSSVFFGVISSGYDFEDNVKRAFQLSLMLSLVFFDYRLISYIWIQRRIAQLVFLVTVYLSMLFFLFLFSNELYSSYMALVYPESIEMLDVNFMTVRFSYRFTDPNSLAYFLVLVFVLILSLGMSMKRKYFYSFIVFLLVVSTQSRGGIMCFFIVFITHLFFVDKIKISLRYVLYSLNFLFFSILIFYFLYDYVQLYYSSLQARREIEVAMGSTVGGTRLENWFYFFSNLNLYPFGFGYNLYKENDIFRPHSDFIRLNLSYGFFSIFLFFALFNNFSTRFYSLWVAFLMPFLINTIIDDYRIFGIFILIYIFLKNKQRFLIK